MQTDYTAEAMKTEKQIAVTAAEFAERWKGRGYERGESQPFWNRMMFSSAILLGSTILQYTGVKNHYPLSIHILLCFNYISVTKEPHSMLNSKH